jgi:hypothetical protein
MGRSITTKFEWQEKVWLRREAMHGKMTSGIVERIVCDIGGDGTSVTRIYYKVNINSVIAPPLGMWSEAELLTEEEAKQEAKSWHEIQEDFHKGQAQRLS